MTKDDATELFDIIKYNLIYIPSFIRSLFGILNIKLDVEMYNDKEFYYIDIFEINEASSKHISLDKLFGKIFDSMSLRATCVYDENKNVIMSFTMLCNSGSKHVRYDIGEKQIFKVRNNNRLKHIN